MVMLPSAVSSPLWQDVVTAANDSIRTAVILIAGLVGYGRFVRGRALHAGFGLTLDAAIKTVNNKPAAAVTTSILNNGSFKMIFPVDCSIALRVACADRILWDDAAEDGEVFWSEAEVRTLNLLATEGVQLTAEELEPGESLGRTLVFPIPDGKWVAYRFSLIVQSRPKFILRVGKRLVWTTHTIVVV